MPKYCIQVWDIGSHTDMPNHVEIHEFDDLNQASEYAYEQAVENYESYGGLHGFTLAGAPCDECDGEDDTCNACNGTGTISDEYGHEAMEDSLHYLAEEYDPAKHDEMFENVGEEIPT